MSQKKDKIKGKEVFNKDTEFENNSSMFEVKTLKETGVYETIRKD